MIKIPCGREECGAGNLCNYCGLIIYLRKRLLELQPEKAEKLCGGCHQWGWNPTIKEDGKCSGCERTEEQIRERHEIFWVEEL